MNDLVVMQVIKAQPDGVRDTGTELSRGTGMFPGIGFVSTFAGTCLAIALVPDNPEPIGELYLSGLAMSCGLAVAPLLAMLRDPKSILRGEHVLVLAPIYWLLLDLVRGTYVMEAASLIEVRYSFIAIGLFSVAVWLSAWHRPWGLPRMIQRSAMFDLSPNTFFIMCLVVFCLGITKFAYPCDFDIRLMVTYLGVDRWAAPWNRGQFGGWDAFLDHMQYFGYLLPSLAVVMARKTHWWDPRTGIVIVLALTMAVFMAQEGGRRNIGVIFGVAVILWMLSQQRLGPRGLLVVGVCALLILGAMQFMISVRNIGVETILNDRNALSDQGESLVVDDNFLRLSQIINLVPDRYPHTRWHHIQYILVRPIPRVFWEGKPMDPGFDLADALDLSGVSLSSSVMGELYMAFGFIGVFVGGWVYGRLAGMATPLATHASTFSAQIMYSIWMMALFAGMRSMLDLVLISYVILAWIGMCQLFAFFGHRSGSA